MIDLFISIFCLYTLVGAGFAWKKWLAPDLYARHLSLLMIYVLAPGLTFWGFSTKPLTLEVLNVALWFLGISLVIMLLALCFSPLIGLGPRRRSIMMMTSVLSNTGNLGIPIGLAFLGPASLPFTAATNMVSVFLNFTIGVYFYSRGNFSIQESLKNIFKLPVIWFGALAIFLNINGIKLHSSVLNFFEITGHMSIGFQLIILGVFLATHLCKTKDYPTLTSSLILKFFMAPIITFGIIKCFALEGILAQTLILQSLMPAAVNNLNLASLYHCSPEKVTPIVFWGSLLGLLIIPIGLIILV